MFVFLGDLKPKEWLNDSDFELNVGVFSVRIQGNRISCMIDYGYVTDFDREIKEPAMSAIQCVELAQSAETYRKFSIEYIAWVEIKLNLAEVMQRFTLGNFIVPGEFPVGNRQFLSDFNSGLRYANQVFQEMHLRIALEDFNRAIGSEWDECIYHCHHCLEAIRDYFGEGDSGWKKMQTSLDVEEEVLRQVTDFSNDFIRHGINKAKLQNMTPQEKSLKAGTCHGICHAVLDKFGVYLNGVGIPFSTVKVLT